MASLLTLSDVLATGHHAAVCGDVKAGGVVAVVGDGAVGLSGVLAASRLGAERVIALRRNPVRQQLAREFGATEIVEVRGEEATEAVKELTGGIGADAVLEGIGRCQRRGGPVEVIRLGDRVFFEPGEDHWHGAAPDRLMTHLAMLEVDEHGQGANWGEHVTDEEYNAVPAKA